MDNGNDSPAHIPCLEISDEKHDSNKQWLYNRNASPNPIAILLGILTYQTLSDKMATVILSQCQQ